MNQAVQALIDDLRLFDSGGGSDAVILDAVKSFQTFALDLNREEQLYKGGRNAEGNRITPGYTPLTVSIKRRKSQPTDRVTLRDTGRFYRSFFIVYDQDEFTFYADDSKTPGLVEKYGPEILGLEEESIQALIEKIRNEVVFLTKVKIFR